MRNLFVGLSFVLALGCGDGGGAAASGSAAASAKKSAAPSASAKPSAAPAASAAPTGTPAGKPEVLATCNDKEAAICKEYVLSLGVAAEETCLGLEKKGVFKKGSEPCTHENALGTCEVKLGDAGEFHHYYKAAGSDADSAKKSCEMKSGVWIPEAAGAASAAPSASAAPASSAAPAAK